jgi:hypothetical protein
LNIVAPSQTMAHMNVRELITALQDLPPDALVLVPGFGRFVAPESVALERVPPELQGPDGEPHQAVFMRPRYEG